MRLEDIAEGQVFLVSHIQEALLDMFPPDSTAADGDVDPVVLFVRLEVGVEAYPCLFVHGWVLGEELSDPLIALVVFPLETGVEGNGNEDPAGLGGHQDRPGDEVPRHVLFPR